MHKLCVKFENKTYVNIYVISGSIQNTNEASFILLAGKTQYVGARCDLRA